VTPPYLGAYWLDPDHDCVEAYPTTSVDRAWTEGIIREDKGDDPLWGGLPWTGLPPRDQPRFEVSATYWPQRSVLELFTGAGYTEEVSIAWVPFNLGGRRPWFQCPGCAKHRRLLRFAHGQWRCRQCHALKYQSQRLGSRDRQLLKASRIRRRLGGEPQIGTPLPPKPPHMSDLYYGLLELKVLQAELSFLGVEPPAPRIRRSIRLTPRKSS
jgi:hypothetical protein